MIDCAAWAILILCGLFRVAIAAKAYKKAKDTTPEDSPYCEPQFPSTVLKFSLKTPHYSYDILL